jgi:hypothetical protein
MMTTVGMVRTELLILRYIDGVIIAHGYMSEISSHHVGAEQSISDQVQRLDQCGSEHEMGIAH